MKPVAWLATGDDGREVAISEYDLRLQRPGVQELWQDAEPLYRLDPDTAPIEEVRAELQRRGIDTEAAAKRVMEAVRRNRSDFERDMM